MEVEIETAKVERMKITPEMVNYSMTLNSHKLFTAHHNKIIVRN
jgi:hypothetical protein